MKKNVNTDTKGKNTNVQSTSQAKSPPVKWVHVVCAKWQGLTFINNETRDVIEDVTELKSQFRMNELSCYLCKGLRGSVNKCKEEGCNNWMHVTCARSTGLCRVVHGEDHVGVKEGEDAWTLRCMEHSEGILEMEEGNGEGGGGGKMSLEQLVAAAKAFPVEKVIKKHKPKPKPLREMNGKERKKFFDDSEYEQEFVQKLLPMVQGARCAICDLRDDNEETDVEGFSVNALRRCEVCNLFVHRECYSSLHLLEKDDDGKEKFICDGCKYTKENHEAEDFELPMCHMCNQKGGPLNKAFARPVSMKSWKNKQKNFKKSLFGKLIWCHAVCGMWHPHCIFQSDADGGVNCSSIIMANGITHINSNQICNLCGRNDKIKMSCGQDGCRATGDPKKGPNRFHLSCARQAGLEVSDKEVVNTTATTATSSTKSNNNKGGGGSAAGEGGDGGGATTSLTFYVKCFHHVRSDFVLRARMEDMIELERVRAGLGLENTKAPMSVEYASRVHHWAENILQILGWAWIWAEWWVSKGDNWEPLLEEGEKEEDMTKEQLRIVDSTPESRCADARRCRLAAFGAALRNREYDKQEGDDRIALDRALRAVLNTSSLVGPLRKIEIDFFAEWLGRSYRSKSKILGFGEDKIPVADKGHCLHIEDGSPKYVLGSRTLPGKQTLPKGAIFESNVVEVDDFLKPGLTVEPEREPKKKKKKSTKEENHQIDL